MTSFETAAAADWAVARDAHLAVPDYVYGTNPTEFVRREASRLVKGSRVLSVADGEGRNSVWLAGQGHRVTAFESCMAAVEKARRLAAERGEVLALHRARVEQWDWDAPPFDAVFGVFIQFAPPDLRRWLFARMADAVRPGGLLFLHGFSLRNAGSGGGGPRDAALLYTPEMMLQSFPGWQVLLLDDHDADLDEGVAHSGSAALVDFVARRPL